MYLIVVRGFEDLLPAGIIFVLLTIIAVVSRQLSGGSVNDVIIEAEKNRKEFPNIQDGMFTRLFTMPYDKNLTAENIRAYCEEHFPSYFCSTSRNMVRISETKNGLSGEVRNLYITQLPGDDISAIDLKDPHEVEYFGRGRQFNTRSSLDDKGFSKNIREMIHHFQQQAIAQAN